PGGYVKPLARIGSGGELSRIMLALKTLASTDAPGKTLIFDEGDAGIGGAGADRGGGGVPRARRRARRGRRGRPTSPPGAPVPGALHPAPAANRRVRIDALSHRQKHPKWT